MMWSIAPWWHWLAMIAFWGLVIALAVWAIGFVVPRGAGPSTSARELLDERLARGELDADEYRHRRELLER